MFKRTIQVIILLFAMCNQSIQASDTPCISEEMCRSLIKEASKHKITNKDDIAIACCFGGTICCCLCLSAVGEAQKKEKNKKVDAGTQTDPEKSFFS